VRSWKRCAPEAQLRIFVSTQFTRQYAAKCCSGTAFSHSLGQLETQHWRETTGYLKKVTAYFDLRNEADSLRVAARLTALIVAQWKNGARVFIQQRDKSKPLELVSDLVSKQEDAING
jgi:hypothetical protein